MIAFLVLASLLVLGTLAVLVLALRRARVSAIDRERLNVAIFRERQAELDAELAAGRVDAVQHAALLAELQALLVDDVAPAPVAAPAGTTAPRAVALVLLVTVPLAVGVLHVMTGFDADSRDWLRLGGQAAQVDALPQQIDAAAARASGLTLPDALRLRQAMLRHRPVDADAWFRLGLGWLEAEMPGLALEAFRTARHLAPERSDIALGLARMELGMGNGRLTDEVRALLDQVLAADPAHQGALLVYGMAAFDSGEYALAVTRWETLLAQLDPASRGAGAVRDSIARARQAAASAAPAASIPVQVTWSPAFGEPPPDTTLFVIVRVAGGPPMPVAARKLPARFPAEVTLTDADQMMPGAPLASRGPLEVRARVSLRGSPMPAPGDLESAPVAVTFPLTAPLRLVIDRRVP